MKKLLSLTLLLSTLVFAEEVFEADDTIDTGKQGLYFGLDLFNSDISFEFENTTFNSSADFDSGSKGFRLKMGTVADDNWRVQGHLSVEEIDDNIFSLTGTDGDLVELGVDVIKAFEMNNDLSLFVLGGASYGFMSVKGYKEDTVNNAGVKIGAGVLYAINETLEFTAGIDFRYRVWSDVELLGQTIETSDSSSYPYIGVNFHF